MRRVTSAGAVIFRRDRDGETRFLLLYYGRGYWNFPKGKIEQGERAMAAFLREVEEETGLKHADLRLLYGFRTSERFTFVDRYASESARRGPVERGKPLVFKLVIYYLVESRRREVTISEEHDGFGWFSYQEALRIAKYQNTKNILKQAYEFIRKSVPGGAKHPPRPGRHVR